MKSYTHFTREEREFLEEKLKEGKSIRWIAEHLDRSPSSVSREVKRNWSKKANRYNSWNAENRYKCRRKKCHRKNYLESDPEANTFVRSTLEQYWPPEMIATRWNLCHERKIYAATIYRAVRAGLFPEIKPETHLRRRGKRYDYQPKSSVPHPESSIHDRPEIVDLRKRVGDMEGDTVYGSVGKGYLVTVVDRLTGMLFAAIAKDKKKETTSEAIIRSLENSPIQPLTLTLDNGTEFAAYRDVEEKLKLKVYFADPCSPWQRGCNENANGLLRFFFPRGTNFNEVSDEELQRVVALINNRPRKRLGALSPIEYLEKLLLHLA